jgi:hypothetical protein
LLAHEVINLLLRLSSISIVNLQFIRNTFPEKL